MGTVSQGKLPCCVPAQGKRDYAVKLASRWFVPQYAAWLMILSGFLRTVSMLAFLPLCLGAAGRSDSKFALDGRGLAAGEKFVLEQLAAGKSADLKSQFGEGTNSVLRGAFLEALLSQPGTNVHRNGISIEHAVVLDAVDLRNTTVRYEVTVRAEMTTTMKEAWVTDRNLCESRRSYKVHDAAEDGTGEVDLLIEWVHMIEEKENETRKFEPVEFQSDDKTKQPPKFFHVLDTVGRPQARIRFSPIGNGQEIRWLHYSK